jgi:putative inorganic carbon (HCO3(-)) transporter
VTFRRLPHVVGALDLPVLLVIAPALLFPTPRRLLVLAVVPVVWLCLWLSGDRPIPRTPFNTPLGVLLVMVGVSLFATFDVGLSLGKVAGVVLGALLFWALVRWINTPARLRVATTAFVLAGVALALIGLFGVDYSRFAARFPDDPGKFPIFATMARRMPQLIRGLPGAESGFNPNAVAGSLVLFIPLQVALLAGRWGGMWMSGLQVLLLLVTSASFAVMQSRGAFLGLIVAGVAFLCWHSRRTRILAIAATVVVLLLGLTLDPTSRVSRAIAPVGTGLTHTVTVRLELWSSGLQAIKDFPLTGMGMNTFRKLMPLHYPIATVYEEEKPHAHNHLIQAGIDLGIPGLVAYLALWVIAARELIAVHRRARERIHAVIASGLAAGLIAGFVFGIADAIPLGAKVGVLFWVTLALVAGLRRVALPQPVTTL